MRNRGRNESGLGVKNVSIETSGSECTFWPGPGLEVTVQFRKLTLTAVSEKKEGYQHVRNLVEL